MRKLRIFLDSDDVVVDNIEEVLRRYNEEYNQTLKIDQLTSWELDSFKAHGTEILKYFVEPGFFRHLTIKEGAVETIQRLIEEGHDVFISTASNKVAIQDKLDFFEEYFPFIPYEQVLPITRKDVLKGDIMLDDALHNLDASSCTHKIVFDKPWNEITSEEYIRVHSWSEFYEIVKYISEGNILPIQ